MKWHNKITFVRNDRKRSFQIDTNMYVQPKNSSFLPFFLSSPVFPFFRFYRRVGIPKFAHSLVFLAGPLFNYELFMWQLTSWWIYHRLVTCVRTKDYTRTCSMQECTLLIIINTNISYRLYLALQRKLWKVVPCFSNLYCTMYYIFFFITKRSRSGFGILFFMDPDPVQKKIGF